MVTKKESSKAKAEKPKSVKPKSATRKTPIRKIAKVQPAKVEQASEANPVFIDEKSLRTIRSLTGYLGVAAGLNAFFLIVQLWATFKVGYVLSWVSFVYILFSIALIGALVWCIKLLKQRKLLVLWVFVGFIAINFLYTLIFRFYGGKDLFSPLDIVAYIVQAAIFIDLYRLKSKDILE